MNRVCCFRPSTFQAFSFVNGLITRSPHTHPIPPTHTLTHRLLERVGESSSSVDSLTSGVLSTQSELSAQRKELSDLEAQVPQLNDAKKTAVTGELVHGSKLQ